MLLEHEPNLEKVLKFITEELWALDGALAFSSMSDSQVNELVRASLLDDIESKGLVHGLDYLYDAKLSLLILDSMQGKISVKDVLLTLKGCMEDYLHEYIKRMFEYYVDMHYTKDEEVH